MVVIVITVLGFGKCGIGNGNVGVLMIKGYKVVYQFSMRKIIVKLSN